MRGICVVVMGPADRCMCPGPVLWLVVTPGSIMRPRSCGRPARKDLGSRPVAAQGRPFVAMALLVCNVCVDGKRRGGRQTSERSWLRTPERPPPRTPSPPAAPTPSPHGHPPLQRHYAPHLPMHFAAVAFFRTAVAVIIHKALTGSPASSSWQVILVSTQNQDRRLPTVYTWSMPSTPGGRAGSGLMLQSPFHFPLVCVLRSMSARRPGVDTGNKSSINNWPVHIIQLLGECLMATFHCRSPPPPSSQPWGLCSSGPFPSCKTSPSPS